ncbi:FCD domain-containing protein [Rhizobium jaguaris]|nr:FCD domain-containing protein [Rhizobium jaguaris]
MKTPDLDILRFQSMTSVLKHEIEQLVLSGHFASGERLNENALATRFQVSRGPIREACRALAESGLLELIPNRGVFVRSVSEEEALDVYDVRAALFGLAARLSAARMSEADLAKLDELLDTMDRFAEQGSLDEYYPVNLKFHQAILQGSGNKRLVDDYAALIKELHLFRARGLLHGGGLERSNLEHRQIVDALKARDPEAAFRAAFDHVQRGKDRMLHVEDPGRAKELAGKTA